MSYIRQTYGRLQAMKGGLVVSLQLNLHNT